MRILIVTDSFPPNCGGSGWSTYELCRGLRARGHVVGIVQPRPGQASDGEREHDGFLITELAFAAPPVPFVRNYFKNERLWRQLAARLVKRLRTAPVDVVHGQHVASGLPAVHAAHAAGIPAVVTVRDYWPVCYWSDLIYDFHADHLCPECTVGNMRRCVAARAGPLAPAAWPMIPYMRANLRRKRTGLAAADAVIAVSTTIAGDLRARAPELAATRLETIPNPVDVDAIHRDAEAQRPPLAGPYAIYVGKLEPNKGADHLVRVAGEAGLTWPLIVAGDGKLRAQIESEARARGQDVRILGWRPRAEVLGWLKNAGVLVFPSFGPESLSRVLLEAAALGVPIAAMDTGGTRDIVRHGTSGLLSASPTALAADVRRLVADRALAETLAHAACVHVEQAFAAGPVVARVEALYESLRQERPRG